MDLLDRHRHGCLGVERRSSRSYLVEYHAEGIHIAAAIELAPQALLGRRVGRSADETTCDREASRRLEHLGDAEVGQEAIALLINQDIAGLDVPMDDASRMRVVQGRRNLSQNAERARRGEWLPSHRIRQCAAPHVAHHQIGVAIVLAVVVDRQDVGVLQVRDQLGFLLEAADEGRVRGVVAGQDLQGDIPVDARLIGLIDRRHTPLAERGHDTVLP